MEFVYQSLSDLSGNDQEEKKKKWNSEIICSEHEPDPRTKYILKQSFKSDKVFATMRGLGMPIKNTPRMKLLAMS